MAFPPVPSPPPDPEGVIRPAPSTCRSAPNRERPSVLTTDKHPHPSGRIRFLSRLGGGPFGRRRPSDRPPVDSGGRGSPLARSRSRSIGSICRAAYHRNSDHECRRAHDRRSGSLFLGPTVWAVQTGFLDSFSTNPHCRPALDSSSISPSDVQAGSQPQFHPQVKALRQLLHRPAQPTLNIRSSLTFPTDFSLPTPLLSDWHAEPNYQPDVRD